jgi:hypothetical protein
MGNHIHNAVSVDNRIYINRIPNTMQWAIRSASMGNWIPDTISMGNHIPDAVSMGN